MLPKIFLSITSIYLIEKLLIIRIIQKKIMQKIMIINLPIQVILINQNQMTLFIYLQIIFQSYQKIKKMILKN